MADRPIITTKPPVQHQRLKIYLRSGNALMIDGVLSYQMKLAPITNRIAEIEIVQDDAPQFARLLVQTLDLSQIEAVVELPADGARRPARESEYG